MNSDRRKFIKTVGQGVILTGVLGVSASLLLREESSEPCDFDFICRNCKRAKSCELPEAKTHRENADQNM